MIFHIVFLSYQSCI